KLPFSTNEAASLVIGQSSLTTATGSTTANGLIVTTALTFDPSGNLWVSDDNNNRILKYPITSNSFTFQLPTSNDALGPLKATANVVDSSSAHANLIIANTITAGQAFRF